MKSCKEKLSAKQIWLNGLKPGDPVIEDNRHWSSIEEVADVLKAWIILKNGRQYLKDGKEDVKRSSFGAWSPTRLEEPTLKRLTKIRDTCLRVKLKHVDWQNIDGDTLVDVVVLLRSKGVKL